MPRTIRNEPNWDNLFAAAIRKTKQGKDLVKDSRTLLKFIKMWENMDY
jgi:hypothetical protein